MQPPAPPAAPALPANLLEITLALALAAVLAAAAALTAGRIARRLLTAVGRESALTEPLTLGTLRALRIMTFFVAFALFAFPALELAGVSLQVGLHPRDLGRWAAETGIRIAAILLLAFAVVRILTAIIMRTERDLAVGTGLDALERRKRAQTVASVVSRALSALVWATAVLVVLRELDVDITPVLTGAGIVGLAIGFGAQTLVRDVISGFFLIVEDQVRVGDVAMVNGTGGLVEQINLRTIVLRDFEGVVHVFPNGEIKTLANRTKDFSYYVIDLGIEYDEDADRVMALVREAGTSLMQDPAFASSILEPVEVLGVDDFKDSSVSLRFRIKTVPLKQWEVGRELRRRIKLVLDREGVRIPSPRMDITIAGDVRPATPPPARQDRPTMPRCRDRRRTANLYIRLATLRRGLAYVRVMSLMSDLRAAVVLLGLLSLATPGVTGLSAQSQSPRVPTATLIPAPTIAFVSSADSNSPAVWDLIGGRATLTVLTSFNGWPTRHVGTQVSAMSARGPIAFDAPPLHGVWMEAVIVDTDGTWYGYYHNELPAEVCGDATHALPRIGAARSEDFGATWQDLGIILEAPRGWFDCQTANRYFVGGVGDFTAVLDRDTKDLYFFFSQYASRESAQGVSVARMAWADRDEPAGRVSVWWRGSIWLPTRRMRLEDDSIQFSYPAGMPIYRAQDGWHDDQIVDAFWGPSVHWNTYLEQYVMLLNRARDAEWHQEGIYIAFSPTLGDPAAWSAPQRLLAGGSWYPQVIGLEPGSGTDKIAGERARLFISGRSNYFIEFEK